MPRDLSPAVSEVNARRIWIVGPCGSGKSTLASRLGALLEIPVHHLDEIHWKPGWVEAEPVEEAARVAEIVAADSWIIDGNYARLRALHHDRIDLVIRLDYPLAITFPRLVRRTIRRYIRGELICNGNRESLRMTLLSRDSILWWALSTHHTRCAALERELRDVPHVRFRRPCEVDAFLAAARAASDGH